MRKDLEFFPVSQGGQQFILIKDHLGLVQEGKAVSPPLYRIMVQLDSTKTVRDIQMFLMRQKGGILVGMEEVEAILNNLDESYLLDSAHFQTARDRIIADFASASVRPCTHCGRTYPAIPSELNHKLDEILNSQPPVKAPKGNIQALIAPHIDLSVGHRIYSSAYQMLRDVTPSTIVVLGVGHHMANDLFSITEKDFETPLGTIRNNRSLVQEIRESGGNIFAENDFVHRSEHSIEFQTIFLKYLLGDLDFTIIPILCGSIQANVPEYTKEAYLEKAGPLLQKLRETIGNPAQETLLVAGVDFSHVGPKFGHEMPAQHMVNQSEAHDKNLLEHLVNLDADHFWEESRRVMDAFNVCGFSALACLLELLPESNGTLLDYEIWHEDATRSAVSFASVVFHS